MSLLAIAVEFPDFNVRSTPLLLLVMQGLLFVALLFWRYSTKRRMSDLFLGCLLLVVCYQQICFTVGFMGWYNTFRNTKINYWLIPMSVAVAPLIYLYVRSLTTSTFRFRRKDWLHFVIPASFIMYRASIYIYDALQPGFEDTQNGVLKIAVDETYAQTLMSMISFPQMLLYLAFTFQLYYTYRKKINAFFSNTYKLELNWILSFLIAFTILFLYGFVQTVINALFVELNYEQQYWLNILMAIVVLFVGIKGYFTDTTKLKKLDFSFSPKVISIPEVSEETVIDTADLEKVITYMDREKPYLDPDLNLITLSRKLNYSRAQLSEIINQGTGKNFNDFVNTYRVNAVKDAFEEGKQEQLSLLGIALECGFNSKATFNRVFKKLTQSSPSEFLKQS